MYDTKIETQDLDEKVRGNNTHVSYTYNSK